MHSGSFREDLYFRLSVISINLPPLKDRGEDLLVLAYLFLHKYAGEYNKRVRSFSTAALKEMQSYDWPGNVRELENRVRRAVVMAESAVVDPKSLGFTASDEPAHEAICETSLVGTRYNLENLTLKEARVLVERDLILTVLEREDGNVSKAATTLGVTRPTMYDLLKKHNLMAPICNNHP
jgi:two-component system NtrC family response regulator